ncbi:FGGY-family carbohydrate kinase [Ancylobacter lacus]|uniref:FGGY-family carbohydrate kinase n=1 Tax=Ancylobacter lacus TaxID=2579970 RepID=UPI001BD08BD2|nr:FGGY-family carbohydrate kinase [Ancylobacter lacus]MBS7538610.1 carbohydrate kinase [Ancylobacter lacus]
MRECLIGIDAGGTMTKAALFDMEGRELACERRPNQMLFPAPGHTERDPERMWRATCESVQALIETTGIDPGDIQAVSASGYGSGIYLVDAESNPVRPGVVSTDSRAAAIVAEWEASGLAASVAARTQQRLWPGQSTLLMAWFSRHEPEVLGRTARVLYCKDFLRAKLTGEHSTDATDGGIGGAIDVESAAYVPSVFQDMGIGDWLDRMPPIGPSAAVAAGVSAAAARLTGLRAGTPVVRGLVDVTAAAVASGVTGPHQLSMIAGTFSINSTLHATPRTSVMPFLQMPYPIGGQVLATEGAATSASNFEWFCREILDGEAARAVARGQSVYDVCSDMIAAALERDNNILFFPFLFGGPGGAPAGLLGVRRSDVLGDVLRAIFEGVAFAHRMDIDTLLTGPDAARPQVIRLAGGASRSAIWGQIFADVLGLPVEVTDGTELGAQGVAIASAVAIGAYPDFESAVAAMVRVRRRYEPSAERHAFYEAKYARFRAITRTLAAHWPGA